VNELFELGLAMDELAAIGAALGSDVPFLVRGGSAIVEGRGEQVSSLPPVADFHAVLVFPEAACPTAQVYRHFDELGGAALRAAAVRALAARRPAPDEPFNDLAAAAIRAAPVLGRVLSDLAQLAARPAHVSGSGSSVFVICDDEHHAVALAAAAESRLGLAAASVRAVTGAMKASG
jgi:4-diphosphocytidyl-2-C-methyl-D-erythritol kinase